MTHYRLPPSQVKDDLAENRIKDYDKIVAKQRQRESHAHVYRLSKTTIIYSSKRLNKAQLEQKKKDYGLA
jgi:hypothetical protein